MTGRDSQQVTSPSLLVRIRDPGDAESWKLFVSTYAPLVFSYCRKRGLQEADAEDVTQEVFSKISRSISRFEYEPSRGRFRDWLGTVTHGEICRWMTRPRRAGGSNSPNFSEIDVEQIPAANPDTEWTASFHAHILSSALNELRGRFEPGTWAAFDLVWLQDKSAAEAAVQLGVGVEAIYVAKSRVLKRLRERVLELAEELPVSIARPF